MLFSCSWTQEPGCLKIIWNLQEGPSEIILKMFKFLICGSKIVLLLKKNLVVKSTDMKVKRLIPLKRISVIITWLWWKQTRAIFQPLKKTDQSKPKASISLIRVSFQKRLLLHLQNHNPSRDKTWMINTIMLPKESRKISKWRRGRKDRNMILEKQYKSKRKESNNKKESPNQKIPLIWSKETKNSKE